MSPGGVRVRRQPAQHEVIGDRSDVPGYASSPATASYLSVLDERSCVWVFLVRRHEATAQCTRGQETTVHRTEAGAISEKGLLR